MSDADVIIIGSGMGGATLAAQLAPTGRRILIIEKGERLQPSPADRDAEAIFGKAHFRPKEEWLDGDGQPFNPGNYYNVGGNSKFYGAVLLRYRREDFSPLRHMGGTTPGWPIAYDSLEPWYQRAEHLFEVRGSLGDDPTEPPHSGVYDHTPVPDEPAIADLRRRLKSVGLHPASLPLGVDIDTWLAHGKTTWDAFPDTCGGKKDAETVSLAEALRHPNVSLSTGCEVTRLLAGEGGQITCVEVLERGETKVLSAPLVVLAAGAVRSAAILLASADENFPQGLANRSDQVGRNFMNHNCSAVLALHPFRRNPSIYQKTLLVNDFYLTGGPNGEPLGNIQLLGKITGPILAASSPLPRPLAHWIAGRSVDLYAMSEDLPNPESRVTVRNGRIVLDWKRSNWEGHLALVDKLKRLLRKAGYPVVLSRPFDRRTPSHQCGTARMGSDPATSVVDSFGRSHDHSNLFIADASILPTSAAVNPALTIAALALRSGQHIIETEFSQ
jgi:choline dehydrogenase-like flavoprotein